MYNIIPLIIMLASLAAIIVVVGRKFSILANLDLESIQSEREAKFKERIISSRLKRNYIYYYSRFVRALNPAASALAEYFRGKYQKIVDYKNSYQEEKASENFAETDIEKLFLEAEEAVRRDEGEQAESKLIKIISRDSKNAKAFRRLGELYYERKDYFEAKQTIEHAVRLWEKDYDDFSPEADQETAAQKTETGRQLADAYYDIALISSAMEDYAGAQASIDKALAIDANSPRYLDAKLEVCILKKDKPAALEACDKLQAVNPENQKLGEIKERIREM